MSLSDSPAVRGGGFSLSRYDSVGSTSDILKDMAAAGAPDRSVVLAVEQTGGRGRHGRGWASPPGNLYMSVLLREAAVAERLPQLSFVAAVAMGQALSAMLPQSASLRFKWPNDILLNGAKIAGLLLEVGGFDRGDAWVVIGSGVNIASHPTKTSYPATHIGTVLADQEAASLRVESLAAAYLKYLSDWHERWRNHGFAPVRAAWRTAAHRVGEALSVRLGAETVAGRFVDMDAHGGLIVDLPSGETRTITAGEVVPATR